MKKWTVIHDVKNLNKELNGKGKRTSHIISTTDTGLIELTIQGGSASWKKQNQRKSNSPMLVTGESGNPKSNLERRRRRRVSLFAHVLASLRKPPKWHLVFNFDKKVKRAWNIHEAAAIFKKFATYLKKHYPKSWFVYIMEYTPKTGPHFHMLGAFGGKFSRKAIFAKWRKLTNSAWEEAAVIDDFHKRHIGYLTKPKKAKGMRYLIRHLGGKAFWGVINRKNLPLHKKQTFTLSREQFRIFKKTLKKLIAESGGAQSSIARLDTNCNGLRYCTHEMIQTALAAANVISHDEE